MGKQKGVQDTQGERGVSEKELNGELGIHEA